MKDLYFEGFHYDAWANRRWLACLDAFPDPEPVRAVFRHILEAQTRWLSRCGHTVEPSDEWADWLEQLHRALIEWVTTADLDLPIRSVSMAGDVNFDYGRDIARHVVNHGTYHRGQMRGLAQAQGFDGFPETDFIGYTRERNR